MKKIELAISAHNERRCCKVCKSSLRGMNSKITKAGASGAHRGRLGRYDDIHSH
jgi:hypothetical protein